MMLPQAHKLANPPSLRGSLAVRDPVNTNAPGLANNKNGQPGPEGNQKGPPVAVTSSEGLSSMTSQIPPPETRVSSSDNPSPTPASSTVPSATSALVTTLSSASSPSLIAISSTTSSPDLTSSSAILIYVVPSLSTSFNIPSISVTPPVGSLTTTDVSASSDGFSTSAIYLVSGPLPSTLSTVLHPGETTLRTSFTYSSSVNAIQTGMVNYAPKSTASSGQKPGIVVGALAGFAFILTLIFLLFKWCRAEPPNALPCHVRSLLGTRGNSRWLSRNHTPDAMSDSLLTAEVGFGVNPTWDYRATFALPTVTEKARWSFRKSLTRLLRFNPLGLNPVTRQGPGTRTPSRKSFASFFHQLSAASNRHSAFCPSFLQGQPESVIDPQSPPLPCASFRSPQPSALPSRSREFAKSETDNSPRPRTMPPQVPPHALQRPWYHRNSQMTMASEKSESHSFKSVPSWVKFHYPYGSNSGEGTPREPGKALPPLRISPGSWLKTKALRRSHSTAASEDEIRLHPASDNGDESIGTKQARFGRSRWKRVQMGRRISGASANSLVAEKQMSWQI